MRLLARSLLLLVSLIPLTGSADEYVGANNCKACHPKEYAHWRRTPHARAFSRLKGQSRRDPDCTSCHATAARQGHVGVQCESCHGPGARYWPAHVMKDAELARAAGLRGGRDPQLCARCHTADAPTLRAFDHGEALKAVIHPKATKGPESDP